MKEFVLEVRPSTVFKPFSKYHAVILNGEVRFKWVKSHLRITLPLEYNEVPIELVLHYSKLGVMDDVSFSKIRKPIGTKYTRGEQEIFRELKTISDSDANVSFSISISKVVPNIINTVKIDDYTLLRVLTDFNLINE